MASTVEKLEYSTKNSIDDIFCALLLLCQPGPGNERVDIEQANSDFETSLSDWEQIHERLHHNLTQYESFLLRKENLRDSLSQPPCFRNKSKVSKEETDVRWEFVQCCLDLLVLLGLELEVAVSAYTEEERDRFAQRTSREAARVAADASAPHASPDAFNEHQRRGLLRCFQLVVGLGVLPCLASGVGVPIKLRSEFAQLILSSSSEVGLNVEQHFRLAACIRRLAEVTNHSALGELLLNRHLGDMLAGLCQVVFAPRPPELRQMIEQSKHEQKTDPGAEGKLSEAGSSLKLLLDDERRCNELLSSLMQRLQPSPLVREIFLLQGGAPISEGCQSVRSKPNETGKRPQAQGSTPPWMQRACRRLLSDILIRPRGVRSVLDAIFHDEEGGSSDVPSGSATWRKHDAAATIIATCPPKVSPAHYYGKIAPQVLQLLRHPDGALATLFLRVGVSTIAAMLARHPQVAKQLVVAPLMQPLLSCLAEKDIKREEKPKILVEEMVLTGCIEDIHKVFVAPAVASAQSTSRCGAAGAAPITFIHPALMVLFGLFCFTRQGVVKLRSACEEILVSYLQTVDQPVAIQILKNLAYNQVTGENDPAAMGRLHPDVMFAPGPTGACVVISKPLHGEFDFPPVEDWETRCACVVDLIKCLRRDAITADFFLSLLDSLTKLISKQKAEENLPSEPAHEPKSLNSANQLLLLDIETHHAEMEKELLHGMIVLHLLAMLAEEVGPACFSEPVHILAFVKVTLERCVFVLRATDDEMTGVFESETVTMAMGLLTALMGNSTQISASDKDAMQELLPLLQDLADFHPDSEVQEMATDLRIAIATRGAIWTDLLEAAKRTDKGRGKGKVRVDDSGAVKAESLDAARDGTVPKSRNQGRRPLIEVISSSPTSGGNEARMKGADGAARLVPPGGVGLGAGTSSSGPAPTSEPPPPTTSTGCHEGLHSQSVPATVPSGETSTSLGPPDTRPSGSIAPDKGWTAAPPTTTTSDDGLSPFGTALQELYDPLVPVRGHGLISLRRLLQGGDKEALQRTDLLLRVFRENLDHADSYIYLAAVEGLATLGRRSPDLLLPVLAQEYAEADLEQERHVGQCHWQGQTVTAGKPEKKPARRRSAELRMKLGEVLVKTCRSLGEMTPKYRDLLLASLLTGARDPDELVRASCISNLGELCGQLHFALGSIIHEVLNCVSALVKSDPAAEVRKAAALFTTLLLQGLGKNAPQVLETTLRDLYRLLKHVLLVEKEDMVRVHVTLALDELDTIMRAALFPPQELTKRIRVLDPN